MRASRTIHYEDISKDQLAWLAIKLLARCVADSSKCLEIHGVPLHSGHVQVNLGSPSKPPFVRVRAHVLAWELANRQSVPAGKVVMHACDNPRCINPDHLSIGTQGDNVRDSICKGRYNAFGIQRLNAAQVQSIRRQSEAGVSRDALAKEFNMSRHSIGNILRRDTWAHLPVEQEGR